MARTGRLLPADAAPFEHLVQRLVRAALELLGSLHCVDASLQIDRAPGCAVLVDQRGELAQCQPFRATHPSSEPCVSVVGVIQNQRRNRSNTCSFVQVGIRCSG